MYYLFIVKIYIQCNKPEITSVTQKILLLLVNRASCQCRRGAAVVRSGDICVHSFRVVLELCVMDEEGVFVCLCAFLLAVFAFDFHWSFGSVTARTSTTENFCLPHTRHIHALKHTHTLPPFIPQVCLNLP